MAYKIKISKRKNLSKNWKLSYKDSKETIYTYKGGNLFNQKDLKVFYSIYYGWAVSLPKGYKYFETKEKADKYLKNWIIKHPNLK